MTKWTAAVVLCLASSPAFAQDEHIGVRVREWFARMAGTMEADDGGGNSTRVDLAHDLGLGDRNLTHELQAYVRLPILGRISAGWWRAHDTGSETLSRNIEFEGFTYTASTRVDSEVTLDVAYLGYEFALPTVPIGDLLSVEVAVGVSARGLRGEGSISESSGGQSEHEDGVIGLPTLSGHVTVTLLSMLRAEVEVQGMAVSYRNWEAKYLEVYAEVTVQPLPFLFAGVGYKLANINIDHEGRQNFHLDVGVSGLYITVGARF